MKQRFSELARRGEEVVVVVPARKFRRLTEDTPDFKESLMGAPEGLEFIIPERPPNDYPREVDHRQFVEPGWRS